MFKPIKLSSTTIEKPVFAAPLAGITDRPYRRILRGIAPNVPLMTEMISCHSIVGGHKNCSRNFDRYDDEGLIGAQIFGAEPTIMAAAAKILQDQGASWIDINMGCPVPKVATRAGAGAFLMRDHALAGKIVESVVKAVQIPVSIKTRLGWDEIHKDWDKLVHIAANAGASMATLHGRTRAAGYVGRAQRVRVDNHNFAIPVIMNGDIKDDKDMAEAIKLGYSGAMIGRGLLGNPWIMTGQPRPDNIADTVLEHFGLILDYYGPRAGVPLFRKHAAWYSAGMAGSSDFRTRVNQISDPGDMQRAIKEFFIAK